MLILKFRDGLKGVWFHMLILIVLPLKFLFFYSSPSCSAAPFPCLDLLEKLGHLPCRVMSHILNVT